MSFKKYLKLIYPKEAMYITCTYAPVSTWKYINTVESEDKDIVFRLELNKETSNLFYFATNCQK